MKEQNIIDQIYEIVEKDIDYLSIFPGDALSESSLCARFNVSRTPIRSVLQKLNYNGLVNITSRKITTVTFLNFSEITQMIYERIAVESMILRDFIKIASGIDVERVKFYINKQMEIRELMKNDPSDELIPQFYDCDISMHMVWFNAMNKMYLWNQINRGNSSYNRFRVLDMKLKENFDEVIAEHCKILDAIERHDTKHLEEIMSFHLNGGIRRLGDQIFTTYKDYFEDNNI